MTMRLAIRLLVLGLILTVSTLGIHTLIHAQDYADSGQHCQVCHISQAGVPLPATLVSLDVPPVSCEWHASAASVSDSKVFRDNSSPRAPPV